MVRVEVESLENPEDVFALDPDTLDPERHYRFCSTRKMAQRRAQGYEVVLRSSGVALLNDTEVSEGGADDLIRVGNLVLMSCPKDRFNKRRAQIQSLSRARLGSSERNFEARAKKRGVQTITESEGENK